MFKKVGVVIPALEKNRYSQEGDLVRFGDLSLLEWKLIQVKNFMDDENIYVATPSRKVEKVANTCGVNVVKRKDINMANAIAECVKQTTKEVIVWTHVTSPFVSSRDFKNMLQKFLKLDSKYDSLISVFKLQEFIVFKNNALNFIMTEVTQRNRIEPVYRITNGCFIAKKDIYLKYENYLGERPFLYEIDMLASMEIKDVGDLSIASDLISLFFKKELDI